MEKIISQISLTHIVVFGLVTATGLGLIWLWNKIEEKRRLRDAGRLFPQARHEGKKSIRKNQILDGKLMPPELLDEHERAIGA